MVLGILSVGDNVRTPYCEYFKIIPRLFIR